MSLRSKDNNGETASIIERCIYESAIKLMWSCNNSSNDKFNIYISGLLKNNSSQLPIPDNGMEKLHFSKC